MDQFQAYSVQKSPENVWNIHEAGVGWERLEKKKMQERERFDSI